MTAGRKTVVEASPANVAATVVTDRPPRVHAVASSLATAGEGLEVTAVDVDGALERVEAGVADCIVATDSLAGRTWRSFFEAVRDRRPEVPFVLLGTGEALETAAALEAGVTDCLEVPDAEDRYALLARRIRTYGEKYRSERGLERFRTIFANAPDAIVVHDGDGNYVDANRRACEMLGYDREELLERNVRDVEVGVESADLEAFWRTCAPGESVTVEGRNRRADGSELPVRVSLRRIDPGGDPQFVAVVRDVTELKDRECELQKSLDFLRKTEEIADAGGWDADARTGAVRWTEGARRIHGVDSGYEPSLEEALEFYHPEDRPRIREAIETALEYETCFDETARLETAGGLRWVRLRGESYVEDGETIRLRGAIWDITERERRERKLSTSNAKLQALSTALPDVTLLLDEEGRYREVFAADDAESLLYAEPDDLIGEETREVLPPEQAERVHAAIDRALETGEVQTTEYRLEVPAGDRWFEGRVAPLEDRIEGKRAVVAAIRDVTERKGTAEKLREREAHLEQAQSVANVGSWYKDVRNDEIHWSDEVYSIFGLEAGEGDEPTIDHERFLEFVHPEDRSRVEREWAGTLEGEPYDVEHRIVVDGETRWVREKARLTFDEQGEPLEAVGVVQDVTERKAYERALERQNERLEVFNRLVRHDLRNQLNVISGYATVVGEHVDDDGETAATRIRSATAELLSIVEEIREVNRLIGADAQHPHRLSTLASEALEAACEESAGCECELAVPDSLWVEGSAGLSMALENVLENALEHNDATRPRVTVSVAEESPAGYVDLRVADNGPGIPELEYELLTGERERSQLEHTSGLGLWTVHWIVTDAGGDVEFDADGGGTVVTLRLPLAERPD